MGGFHSSRPPSGALKVAKSEAGGGSGVDIIVLTFLNNSLQVWVSRVFISHSGTCHRPNPHYPAKSLSFTSKLVLVLVLLKNN